MKLLSKIVSATGWSPIGKPLLIHIDESGLSELADQTLHGSVTSLAGSGTATISLNSPIHIAGAEVFALQAHTRHTGFDFFRLPIGFVAADLVVPSADLAESSRNQPFAIASIRLA